MTIPPTSATWVVDTAAIGRSVHVFDLLDSTNSLALSQAADPSLDGSVFLAREQTAGRGQYGRSWHAPPGSSVLMSVLLFPPLALRPPPLLTAWAAVSVCECISKLTKLPTRIKWPNDVLIHEKKVCGILIEQRTTGRADLPLASVVGIGLNVTQSAAMFADAGLPDAASLVSMSGQSFSFEETARELIHQLDQHFHPMFAGNLTTLESRWNERLGLVGKRVIAQAVNGQFRGRLIDATLTSLGLELSSGTRLQLRPETIRQLTLEAQG